MLECVGHIVPSQDCNIYEVAIQYCMNKFPVVKIRRPHIPNKIHMYRDGRLCLYDHREQPWSTLDNIHETIIPWTAEWLVYYELYLIFGKWFGREAPHGNKEKKLEMAEAA